MKIFSSMSPQMPLLLKYLPKSSSTIPIQEATHHCTPELPWYSPRKKHFMHPPYLTCHQRDYPTPTHIKQQQVKYMAQPRYLRHQYQCPHPRQIHINHHRQVIIRVTHIQTHMVHNKDLLLRSPRRQTQSSKCYPIRSSLSSSILYRWFCIVKHTKTPPPVIFSPCAKLYFPKWDTKVEFGAYRYCINVFITKLLKSIGCWPYIADYFMSLRYLRLIISWCLVLQYWHFVCDDVPKFHV